MASEVLAAWLLTVALHTSALLGFAWLFDRGALRARPAWREMLWRAAFFGGVVTASAQVLLHAAAQLFRTGKWKPALVGFPGSANLGTNNEVCRIGIQGFGDESVRNVVAIVVCRIQKLNTPGYTFF